MTKAEAIEALKEGSLLAHWSFTDEGFIYMENDILKDESGEDRDWDIFWELKSFPIFDEGWWQLVDMDGVFQTINTKKGHSFPF